MRLLETIRRIDAIQQGVEKIEGQLDAHHATTGIPLAVAIPIASALVSVIGALWVWGRAQQKRGDKALEGTINLLSGKMEKLTAALQEDAAVGGALTKAIESTKVALYALRDNQITMKEKFVDELADIKRRVSREV